MSKKIIQLNEVNLKTELKELVRSSVEETLNGLLEQEAQQLTQAAKYERTQERQGYRSGHYERNLTTTSGDVSLKMPKLKGVSFETAIIERYRRHESSVEEALIEMYLGSATLNWTEKIRSCYNRKKNGGKTMEERRTRRNYSEEFKNQMIQLHKSGKPRAEIIREYDLTSSAFDRWVKRINNTGSTKESDNRTPEQEELLKLRKENTQLKMENDVLKQAALIFARK